MWHKKFKIAIIEKNTDELSKLLGDMPEFEKIEDIESALYLLKNATTLLYQLQDDVSDSMKQIKKNLKFLESNIPQKQSQLDIKS